MPSNLRDNDTVFAYAAPRPRGLIVSNPGGRVGWLARRWFPRLSTRSYLAYIRLTRAAAIRRAVKRFMAQPSPPWFTHVEIETLNRCNGACSFCPVNRAADPRPRASISATLFAAILEQLSGIGYAGYLGLFSNNEPLLDPRLAEWAAQARAALPRAFLNLSTNGTLLDAEGLRKLLPHFDRIIVNNYFPEPRLSERSQALREFCLGPEGSELLRGRTLEFCLRNPGDVLTSRAGNAPNRRPPAKPPRLPCFLPFSQLIVRPDGKVSLCCNDALGQATMGDLGGQTLKEVWLGEAFAKTRRAMHAEGRMGHPLCRMCDFVKHDM